MADFANRVPPLEGIHVIQGTGDHLATLPNRLRQSVRVVGHDANGFAALQKETEDVRPNSAVKILRG